MFYKCLLNECVYENEVDFCRKGGGGLCREMFFFNLDKFVLYWKWSRKVFGFF